MSATTVALPAYHGSLPAITGEGVRALWQADWLGADPVVSNGLVIADWRVPVGLGVTPAPAGAGGPADATVAAIRATTGAAVWAVSLPSSLPDIVGLIPAGKVVVVEAGHDMGQAPFLVLPVVTELLGLDQATGRQLWAVPVGGDYQDPAIATAQTAAGTLVVTGDPSGTVTAWRATTGTAAWRTPAGCPLLTNDEFSPVFLAADGSLIAESVNCDPSTAVRRLNPATGKPLWTWRTPTATLSGNHTVAVDGAARDGTMVLVTGLGDPQNFGTTWSAVGLPNPYPWPSRVGPQDPHATGSLTVALDAASGRPRWSQASFESYALTAGAVCGVSGGTGAAGVTAGIQCRDDVTGATTMPDFAPPPEDNAEPPYVADGLAVITSIPMPGDGIGLSVLAVRGGALTTRARLAVRPNAYDTGQVYAPRVVAVDALPGGGYLVLLDRRDLPDSPTLALRLGTAR